MVSHYYFSVTVIHLFLFEVQHIARACYYTQAASLASFRIHYYGSMNFCHKRKCLKGYKVYVCLVPQK